MTTRYDSLKAVGPIVDEFLQIPQANSDVGVDANLNWEMSGSNAASLTSIVHSDGGGIKMLTAGADNDQVIVGPHLDTSQSAVANVKWNTNDQPYIRFRIRTDASVANLLFMAGFSLTLAMDETTDADQAKFTFDGDANDVNFKANVSIGGTDTEADTGVKVSANTDYTLEVSINEDRRANFTINGTLVYQSEPLSADKDLKPYYAIQALTGAAKTLHVRKVVLGKMEQNN